MKRTALLVALLVVPFLSIASAQDDTPSFLVLGQDDEGDNTHEVEGVEQDETSPLTPADLLELQLAEAPDGFRFVLGLADSYPEESVYNANSAEEGPQIDYTYFRYEITFQANDYTYHILVGYYIWSEDDTELYSGFYVTGPDDFYDYLDEPPVLLDTDTNQITVFLDHDMIQDANGRQVRPGDTLTNFYADSFGRSSVAAFGRINSEDRLPDADFITTSWEVQQGVTSSGHIDAFSQYPVRVSNGEATTFLYEVDVINNADYVDAVLPSWAGGAEGWIVTFPDGKVRLDPEESKTIPFLVTVPFAHKHGTYHPFNVTFQSQADPLSVGRIELGVRYTAIPQPAGHHPTVYFHEGGQFSFFNTVHGEDYPDGAEQEELGTEYTYWCGSNDEMSTVFPLSPGLQMGLDFDLEALGEATFSASSTEDISEVTFRGYVVVDSDRPSSCSPMYEIPDGTVAIIESTEPVAMTADETVEATSAIRATEYGDFIEFDEDNQMYFAVVVTTGENPANSVICCPAPDYDIQLQPDTSFFLPLLEYHDDVDEYFDRLSGIDLYATTGQERYVNPGEAIVFRATAQNIGVESATLNLELTGSNLGWAQIIGDDRIKLKPGESQDVAVAVLAPEGSSDGDLADVTLHMTNDDDESIRSLIRFLAEVDTDADHDDESGTLGLLDEELQQSPSPFLPLVFALIGVVLAARRRE